jgi:hypothetical protein
MLVAGGGLLLAGLPISPGQQMMNHNQQSRASSNPKVKQRDAHEWAM